MKVKFINFRRLGADYEDPAYVTKELIRKHWSLYATEFLSFSMGLILAWIYLPGTMYSDIARNLLEISFGILGVLLIVGSLCSSVDNHWYRLLLTSSHVVLALAFILVAVNIKVTMIFIAPSLVSIIVLNFSRANVAYYQWCKSLKS